MSSKTLPDASGNTRQYNAPYRHCLSDTDLTGVVLLTVDCDFDFDPALASARRSLSSVQDAHPKRFTNSRRSTWEANTR